MTERTLAIVKPDGVAAGQVGRVVARIEAEGLKLAAMRLVRLSRAEAEGFYAVHRQRPFFAPLTAFIASYSSPEGLFWAKLSAASTLAIAPILVLGWISQKQLVRGLTFGAVK